MLCGILLVLGLVGGILLIAVMNRWSRYDEERHLVAVVAALQPLNDRDSTQALVWAVNIVRSRVPLLPPRRLPNPALPALLARFQVSLATHLAEVEISPRERMVRIALLLCALVGDVQRLPCSPPLPGALFAAVLLEQLLARLLRQAPPLTITPAAQELSGLLELFEGTENGPVLVFLLRRLGQLAKGVEGDPGERT